MSERRKGAPVRLEGGVKRGVEGEEGKKVKR
jgi:hypothetical protein